MPAPTPASAEIPMETKPSRPILFDVHLDANPPSFEILFLAELDSDYRIAQVPLRELPASRAIAFQHAYSEFEQLTPSELDQLRKRSELVDRTKI
jgi:hypothetical protein